MEFALQTQTLAVRTARTPGRKPGHKNPPPATRPPLVFEVLGTPAPKGSMTARIVGTQAIVTPGGSKKNRQRLRAFDGAVREAARDAVGDRISPPFVGVPLVVMLSFRLQRPSGHWSANGSGGLKPSASLVPHVKPDVDKLARQALDAMTGTVFDDDARIVMLFLAKSYAKPGEEGARIRVSAIADLNDVRELAELLAGQLAAGFQLGRFPKVPRAPRGRAPEGSELADEQDRAAREAELRANRPDLFAGRPVTDEDDFG